MKRYTWNNGKNKRIIAERKISFEEIVFYIERGYLLDVIDNPNQTRYKRQQMFVVRIEDYVYLVPFVENGTETFLKTIIPSRKATRIYLGGGKQNG